MSHRITLGVVVGAVLLFSSAAPAWAGVSLTVVPTVPAGTTVGNSSVPASLAITNTSSSGGGEAGYETDSYSLTTLTLVPSCGAQLVAADCQVGSFDAGVLVPSPLAGTGRVGTACAGRTFTMALVDAAQGKYALTPDAGVVLGPAAGVIAGKRCIVDYTLKVDKAPTIDAAPVTPGLQTDTKAFAAMVDITPGVNAGQTGGGVGTAETTIQQAIPAISIQATPSATLGGQISGQAFISGGSSPTGLITFTAFGPDDAACAAPSHVHVDPGCHCGRR